MKRKLTLRSFSAAFVLLAVSHDLLAQPEVNSACNNLLTGYDHVRSSLMVAFSHRERSIIRSIDIVATPGPLFTDAGAYKAQNVRKIALSCGHMAVTAALAEGVATISVLQRTNPSPELGISLAAYIRYLAFSTTFKRSLIPYSEFSGFTVSPPLMTNFYEINNAVRHHFMSTILLHEFAHHVYNHMDTADRSFAYSRKMEKDADTWAIQRSLKASLVPTFTVFLMALLREINASDLENESKFLHPASIKRAIAYSKAGIDAIDKSEFASIFNRAQIPGYSAATVKEKLTTLHHQLLNLQRDELHRASDPLNYWMEEVAGRRGEARRGLQELARMYQNGTYGLKTNHAQARDLFCKAATLDKNDYDFVTTATSQYACGHHWGLNDGLKKDNDKARYFLEKSAATGYIVALRALKHL